MNEQALIGKIARTWKVSHNPSQNAWHADHDRVGIILTQRADDWTESVDVAWCDGSIDNHWIQEIEVLTGNNEDDRFTTIDYHWSPVD